MSPVAQVVVINTDTFVSEEVIQEAIKGLTEKRCLLDASIQVPQKRLRFIQGLSESISPEQVAYMKSLKESSTHPLLPIRERSAS